MCSATTLIFDLDGTLTDPAEGIGRCINHALTTFGFDPIASVAVSNYIGPPLDQSFRSILPSPSAALVADLVAKYRERYAEIGYAENVVYPGIAPTLSQLAHDGYVLGVCTSKRVDFAEQILQLFDLRQFFAFVSGGDVGIHKHQQLRSLLDNAVVGSNAIMIGDRAVDIVAAKSNGLKSVGVLWGHGSHAELMEAGADHIVAAVSDLQVLFLSPRL